MSRPSSSISRDRTFSTERETTEPDWYKELAANLDKQAVKSKREDYSLYDQINSIVSDKASKFSTVEAKVEDMVERTGLKKMLAQSQSVEQSKQALNTKAQLSMQEPATKQVEIFTSIPELKTFIDNYIEARPGTSIDSVVHDAVKINQIRNKLPANDDLPEEVRRYISFKIGETNKDTAQMHSNDNQLGKVDVSVDKNVVDDPLSVCQPARDGSA